MPLALIYIPPVPTTDGTLTHVTRAAACAACAACAALVAVSTRALAQAPAEGAMPLASIRPEDVTVGSPSERSLLLLSLLSGNPVPTTIRPLSAAHRDALVGGTAPSLPGGPAGGGFLVVSPVVASLALNSHRPAYARDGAVWQGRGATVAATGGLVARYRFFSISLRPIAYAAQNASYTPTVLPPIAPGNYRFPHPLYGYHIDFPYRFGATPVARLEPGESWISVDSKYLGGGFTTASQVWGPASIYPIMVGTEGGGYPRLFAEVRELPLGVGHASVQMSVGRLESSGLTDFLPGGRSRVAPALVARFRPAIVRGVEIGVTRFVHKRWVPDSISLATALDPLADIIDTPEDEVANGLGSVFVRVAPPGGGVDVYGEIYREDYAADRRDFIVEPDHSTTYMLGLRRAWAFGDGVRAVTLEAANGRFSHVQRVHAQPLPYAHNLIREGHTHEGQTIGSSAFVGGGGLTVLFEQVQQLRAHTLEAGIRRTMQELEGGRLNERLSGWYQVRYHRSTHGRFTGTWVAGLALGFGGERGANLTVEHRMHWRPRVGGAGARER